MTLRSRAANRSRQMIHSKLKDLEEQLGSQGVDPTETKRIRNAQRNLRKQLDIGGHLGEPEMRGILSQLTFRELQTCVRTARLLISERQPAKSNN